MHAPGGAEREDIAEKKPPKGRSPMTAHIHSKRRLSNAFQRKDKMDNTDYQIEDYSFEFEEKEWEL